MHIAGADPFDLPDASAIDRLDLWSDQCAVVDREFIDRTREAPGAARPEVCPDKEVVAARQVVVDIDARADVPFPTCLPST